MISLDATTSVGPWIAANRELPTMAPSGRSAEQHAVPPFRCQRSMIAAEKMQFEDNDLPKSHKPGASSRNPGVQASEPIAEFPRA